MLNITKNKIQLMRGDTAQIKLEVTQDGLPYDFEKDTVVFSVKTSTTTPKYVLQKTVAAGVIDIRPEDTENLQYGSYKYDVQLTTEAGNVCTVIPPNIFEVMPEVTWGAN